MEVNVFAKSSLEYRRVPNKITQLRVILFSFWNIDSRPQASRPIAYVRPVQSHIEGGERKLSALNYTVLQLLISTAIKYSCLSSNQFKYTNAMHSSNYVTFRKRFFLLCHFSSPQRILSLSKCLRSYLRRWTVKSPPMLLPLQIFPLPPHPGSSLSLKPDGGCSARIVVHSWRCNSLASTTPQLPFNRPYSKFVDSGR